MSQLLDFTVMSEFLHPLQVKGPQNVSCFLKFSVLSTHLEFFNFLFSFERNPANVYPKIAEGISSEVLRS